MRIFRLLILLLFSELVAGATPPSTLAGACHQNTIQIRGFTNVNDFLFTNDMSNMDISLLSKKNDSEIQDSSPHQLSIKVKSFDCDNKAMYQDFVHLLKADEYPDIFIELTPDQVQKINQTDKKQLDVKMKITIAGISNYYQIPCEIISGEGQCKILSGTKLLQLTDFKISPPEKFLGLVKVDNNIKISFNFAYKD